MRKLWAHKLRDFHYHTNVKTITVARFRPFFLVWRWAPTGINMKLVSCITAGTSEIISQRNIEFSCSKCRLQWNFSLFFLFASVLHGIEDRSRSRHTYLWTFFKYLSCIIVSRVCHWLACTHTKPHKYEWKHKCLPLNTKIIIPSIRLHSTTLKYVLEII